MSQWNLWQIKRPVARKDRRELLRQLTDDCKNKIDSDENLTQQYRNGNWQRFFFKLNQRFAWLFDTFLIAIVFLALSFFTIACTQSFQTIAAAMFGYYQVGFPYVNSVGVLAVLGVIATLIQICRKNNLAESHVYLAYWPIPDAGIIGTFTSQSILLSMTYGIPCASAMAVACYQAGWSPIATALAAMCVAALTGVSIVSVIEAVRRITPLSKFVHVTSYAVVAVLSFAVLALATNTSNEFYTVPQSTLTVGQLMPGTGWSIGIIQFLFQGEETGLAGALFGAFAITYAILKFKNRYSLREIDVDALENEMLIRNEFQQPYKRVVVDTFPEDAEAAREYVSTRLEQICSFTDSEVASFRNNDDEAQQSKLLTQIGMRLALLRVAILKTNASLVYSGLIFIALNAGIIILSQYRSIGALSPAVWLFWFVAAFSVLMSESYFGNNLPKFRQYRTSYQRNYLPIGDVALFHDAVRLRMQNGWPKLLIVSLGIGLLSWLGVPNHYLAIMSIFLVLLGIFLLPYTIALSFPFRENDGRLYWLIPLCISIGLGMYGIVCWIAMAGRAGTFARLGIGVACILLMLLFLYWVIHHVQNGRIDLGGEATYGNRKKRI